MWTDEPVGCLGSVETLGGPCTCLSSLCMRVCCTNHVHHQASRLRSGVSVPLLRAWERRYGIVAPARTASGYRLYDEAALARLRDDAAAGGRGMDAEQRCGGGARGPGAGRIIAGRESTRSRRPAAATDLVERFRRGGGPGSTRSRSSACSTRCSRTAPSRPWPIVTCCRRSWRWGRPGRPVVSTLRRSTPPATRCCVACRPRSRPPVAPRRQRGASRRAAAGGQA